MKRLTLEEFGGKEYAEFQGLETYHAMERVENTKANYQKYLRMSDEEIERFHLFTNHIGENVILHRGRSGTSKMYIVCVQINPDERHPDSRPNDPTETNLLYKSHPYSIRLNYRDHLTNTKREWSGIWVDNPMNITLESEIIALFEKP